MADELTKIRQETAAQEAKIKDIISKKGSKAFQSEFNKQINSGKSVADAFEATKNNRLASIQTSTGTSASRAAMNAGALGKNSSKQSFWEGLSNSIAGTTKSVGEASKAFGKYETLALKNFVSASDGLSQGINEASANIAGGIAGASANIQGAIQGWKAEMNEALKPVSTAIGSTAMMVENIANNPLGAPQLLAQGAVALLDKISPSLASELEGASKSINLENLANLPGQMMGSLRSLTLAADALLSVPFTIVSDIYNGLMDIMEEIANLIDSVVSAIFDFFFGPGGLLDSILPISEIMSMLEAIGELASFVGDIAGLAGGFSAVTNITSQITGAVSNISSVLQNPLQSIPGFNQVTGAIGQVTGALRNPEQFLPAGIGQQMQKISSIPGLGFVSNFGTSIGGTLEGLSQGIFTKALDGYAAQIPMLAPLLGQQSPSEPAVNTQEVANDNYVPSTIRPDQETTNGGHPAFAGSNTASWKIFPEKQNESFTLKTEDKAPDYLKQGASPEAIANFRNQSKALINQRQNDNVRNLAAMQSPFINAKQFINP